MSAAEELGTMIGAGIALKHIRAWQKRPISVAEWVRLERERQRFEKARRTGKLPKKVVT